ncbi:hypothetical protein O6H91_11G092600 [Diphasiastrum complanatum]|uniref:Uncharacterized protein n=1 Tax=Diphasiastrum complanatum TaxID=34168 RepID=A0ACC2CBQ8_DIPCM|nr:hypothetical protein O6H91_11G092600 [Diphasiastrum complanatum]
MLRLQQAPVISRDPNTVRANRFQKAELFVSLFVTDVSEPVREMHASSNSSQRLIKPKRLRYLQLVASILILLTIILAGLLFVEVQTALSACRMKKGSVSMNHATRLLAPKTTERSEEYAAPQNSNSKISRRLQQNHESTLWAAKLALQNEVVLLVKDSLNPDVYHNLTNFRKSFQIMEKVFRIYVYKDGLRPLVHSGPKSGIYASEGLFIDSMERGNQFTVEDPMKATMFFMPFSLRQMVSYLYDRSTHKIQPIKTYIANYVAMLSVKHSFWNASGGSDHFFVSCHDWALKATNSHGQLHQNAVKVVCNADCSQGFDTMKDVSLPETRISFNGSLPSSIGGSPPDQRPYLAFFAGQMHGVVRPILLQYWKDKDPLMRIFEVLPASIASKTSYSQHMKLSKYCLCPAGHEVNSPRLVEAIFSECVPVIIADNFVLPFSNVINWESISVTVLQTDITNLKNVLTSIPEQKYRAMQSRLKDVQQHFLWHDSPQKYDVLTMIIHSLWTQRLDQIQLEDN